MESSKLLALFAAKDLDDLIEAAFRIMEDAVACDFASAFYRTSRKGLLKQRDSLDESPARNSCAVIWSSIQLFRSRWQTAVSRF